MTLQFESQKKDLEKSMTLKRERKKQSMTLRLREIEQQRTSTMVQRQSVQMLKLVSEMRDELRVELKKELLQEKQKGDDDESYSDVSITNSDFFIYLKNNNKVTVVFVGGHVIVWWIFLVPHFVEVTCYFDWYLEKANEVKMWNDASKKNI